MAKQPHTQFHVSSVATLPTNGHFALPFFILDSKAMSTKVSHQTAKLSLKYSVVSLENATAKNDAQARVAVADA